MPAILLGFIFTFVLTAQMEWKQQGDCSVNKAISTNIRRVSCSSLERGFPLRFIGSNSSLYVNTLSEDKSSPVLLGVSSVTDFDEVKFTLNVVLWSLLSLAGLIIVFRGKTEAKH